jgi:exodeoxyribonuclease V alpha subunit
MPGLAQKQMIDKMGSDTPSVLMGTEKKIRWKVLEKLVQCRRLHPIDIYFAEEFLNDSAEEDTAALLCHLIHAAREGHLCIRREGDKIFPSPKVSWLSAFTEDEESQEKAKLIVDNLLKSWDGLPEYIISNGNDNKIAPIVSSGSFLYLQKNWRLESVFTDSLRRILNGKPAINVDGSLIEEVVDRIKDEGVLLEEQAQAIKAACKSRFCIITGGPGTGKTYTAGYLIKTILDNIKLAEGQIFEIALASPTGKAAENLQNSLKKAFQTKSVNVNLTAKTIHSLLGINPYRTEPKYTPHNPLSADLILIDESSMIDVKMMAQLFSSIKEGARLILLGDKDQLPPVESGSLFSDITQMCSSKEELNQYIVELKTCVRADIKEIVEFSRFVNRGQSEDVLRKLDGKNKDSVIRRLVLPENARAARAALLKSLEGYFTFSEEECKDPKSLLQGFQKFRILSPLRKGILGVDNINICFFEHFLQKKEERGGLMVVPLMITRNHYRLDLFNGEVGILFCHDNPNKNYAVFAARNEEQSYYDKDLEVRKFPATILPAYEHAYCLSVHKSQGSEFDHVLLLLPEGSEIFGREVLYTAVTRAKKAVEICTSDDTLKAILKQKPQRISGVIDRFYE